MRDYAKKSFKPTPTPAFNTPGNIPSDLNKNPSKNNTWQYWGVALAIALGGLFTIQMIYKHFHHEPLTSAQNNQNAPIKTLPTVNPNTPPKPVFDFYNMLPKQTPTPPQTNSAQTNSSQSNPSNNPSNNLSNNPITNEPAPILSASPTGMTPQNNAAAPISTISSNSASADKPSAYLIQVGAYRNKDAARSMQARLLLLGLHPSISPMDSGWYQVTLGPFSSINTAKNIRHKLQSSRINSADIKPVVTNQK